MVVAKLYKVKRHKASVKRATARPSQQHSSDTFPPAARSSRPKKRSRVWQKPGTRFLITMDWGWLNLRTPWLHAFQAHISAPRPLELSLWPSMGNGLSSSSLYESPQCDRRSPGALSLWRAGRQAGEQRGRQGSAGLGGACAVSSEQMSLLWEAPSAEDSAWVKCIIQAPMPAPLLCLVREKQICSPGINSGQISSCQGRIGNVLNPKIRMDVTNNTRRLCHSTLALHWRPAYKKGWQRLGKNEW